MTLRNLITQNRALIDEAINGIVYRYDGNGGRGTVPSPPPRYTDEQRRDWIMNDEGLYNWARMNRVRI